MADPIYIFIICFTILIVSGLVINIFSIIYFIMQERKGLPNKLMICLNFSDILSVITLITFSFHILFSSGGNNFTLVVYLLTLIVLNMFPIVSVCVTFAITLLRTIVVYNPFLQIRKRLFTLCLVVTIVIIILLVPILSWLKFPARFTLGGFTVVILSCLNIGMSVATIIVLKKSKIEGHRDRNYAAVTMVILSVLYFVTSFPMLLTLTIPALKDDDEKKNNIYLVMVNLSCLLNPLVYIYRKHQIRTFVKECFQKLKCCRSN